MRYAVSNNEMARFVSWLSAWHWALYNVYGERGFTDEALLKWAQGAMPWNSKEGI